MTRRKLLHSASTFTALSYSRILGAADRIRLGVVGTGGRGQYVMTQFQKTGEVDVGAVCDVYAERIDQALTKAPGARPFRRHEDLLALNDIDAVLIGTPDHWHKGTVIDAARAGKDIYVEKPLTRLREEGPEMVKAVRVADRVCQVGMQQRSGPVYLEARERYIASGALGKISHVRCVWHTGPPRRLRSTPASQPSNLDWARFLGPVRWRDWTPAQYFSYRAFLDFNAGKLADFGAHWVDVVHMFLGRDAPLSAMAAGGVYYDFQDGRTAPDTISALWEYPGNFTVSFESFPVPNGGEYGIEFLGERGRLFINRNRYEFLSAEKGAAPVVQKFPGDITLDHVKNFLECCRSRRRPTADIWIGHRVSQAVLLAHQSYLEKRRIRFDAEREEVLPL